MSTVWTTTRRTRDGHEQPRASWRQTLSNLVNEKASVSIEMAYRLSKAFGSTPETWLGMQLAYDLARSRHLERTIQIERIAAA